MPSFKRKDQYKTVDEKLFNIQHKSTFEFIMSTWNIIIQFKNQFKET